MIWFELSIIGQYVVQYVFKAAKEHQITWAVAGTELKALYFIARLCKIRFWLLECFALPVLICCSRTK